MEISDVYEEKRRGHPWIVAAVLAAIAIAAVAIYASLGGNPTPGAEAAAPATLNEIAGSDIPRITLSPSAMQRLDVATAPVRTVVVGGKGQAAVPYAAVFYDANGETWVYTSPTQRAFVRKPITIDHIEGTQAFLFAGPSVGTRVATVGVQELYGVESGIAD